MSSMYTDVLMFLQACDQGKNEETAKLYFNLIKEEFRELMEANLANDEVERLDACMDLIWVVIGYCIAKGYDINGAWNEVALTNLRKIDKLTGKVKKNEHGKVMKPEGWVAPNLAKFV
jgi:predicted HAD superfamily Cof-like phosphohydrolase